jgi:uncharacterized protein (DUF1800 family)
METNTENIRKIKHLYSRAAFGLPTALANADMPLHKAVKNLFAASREAVPLAVMQENELFAGKEMRKAAKTTDPSDRNEKAKAMIREKAEDMRTLNLAWLDRMVGGEAVLREKMTFFWHGHFACRNLNAFFAQQLNNTIRTHALGNFGDLLRAVSKEAAMLAFLNNRQNRKDSPNENFAREVMELFTLGRGNYTEQDIKNAARAFTGWQFRPDGTFLFNERQHDADEKKFFGKTGRFTGDDILNALLENRQTARFVATKIYRFFVNDQPDSLIINELSNDFYASGYDIARLMERIFTADWFYAPANVGNRVKSPVELLVGLQQTFGVRFQVPQNRIFIQKVLGQQLFFPPSVAGWPQGRNWIDSSSLLFRMRLPQMIFAAAETRTEAKDDGDVATADKSRPGKTLQTTTDWPRFAAAFNRTNDQNLPKTLADFLLSVPLTTQQRDFLKRSTNAGNREGWVRDLAMMLVSLPEYQLG